MNFGAAFRLAGDTVTRRGKRGGQLISQLIIGNLTSSSPSKSKQVKPNVNYQTNNNLLLSRDCSSVIDLQRFRITSIGMRRTMDNSKRGPSLKFWGIIDPRAYHRPGGQKWQEGGSSVLFLDSSLIT
uniref:Uncharacterized protein n=1 Tax=Romanomermis culicivorax TaxID=13658 RepID=A0A915K0J6_ROMCU